MFRVLLRLVRVSFLAALGAAAVAKFALQSHAEPETEEIDLVAIFEGKHLISTADPFYGGKVLVMFGGALIDLRRATPSPTGVILDLVVMLGGVSLIVPEGWRVRFEGATHLSGWSDSTRTTSDTDAPTVTLKGRVIMGGVHAIAKSPVEAVV